MAFLFLSFPERRREKLFFKTRCLTLSYFFYRYFLILVDGLCEAELHRSDGGETVASFLERHFREFPPWLRLVCTVRTGMLDIVKGFPYQRMRCAFNYIPY